MKESRTSAQISRTFREGDRLERGDVIALHGYAYEITSITDTQVFGVQVAEHGTEVYSSSQRSLNLKLAGWALV